MRTSLCLILVACFAINCLFNYAAKVRAGIQYVTLDSGLSGHDVVFDSATTMMVFMRRSTSGCLYTPHVCTLLGCQYDIIIDIDIRLLLTLLTSRCDSALIDLLLF